jgi:non-canonical poly(A) RNA polymerase PAPD5/7
MIRDMLMEPWEPVTQQFDSENDAIYNWHVIDDEPLPRNSKFTSHDTSPSPLQKKKSKSNRKSRKKSIILVWHGCLAAMLPTDF